MANADDILANETVPDKRTASKLAKTMGCTGAHQSPNGKGWHPCESHEALLILINEGAAGYRAYKKRKSGKKVSTVLIDRKTDVKSFRKVRHLKAKGSRGLDSVQK